MSVGAIDQSAFCGRPLKIKCLSDKKREAPISRICFVRKPYRSSFMTKSECESSAPQEERAKLVVKECDHNVIRSTNITRHESKVSALDRQLNMKQKGCVVWMTGLSGSGKSTLAYTMDHALSKMGKTSFVLDGDNIRHGLNKNLGFSAEDRKENIRRVGELSKLFCEANIITLVSFISPYEEDRQQARALIGPEKFLEVYMSVPLCVCERRDPKGLYKLARAGKIKGFTGIDDPYQPPSNPDIVMQVAEDGDLIPPEVMADQLIQFLDERGFLKA